MRSRANRSASSILSPLTALSGCALMLALCSCRDSAEHSNQRPVREKPPTNDVLPAWVNVPPTDLRYVYGVGADIHHDRNRAIADAKRDIARQLRIVIRGDEKEEDELYNDDQTADPAAGSRPRTTIDHLELPGVTVIRQEDTTSATYVLVALNREAWANGLRTRIAELDQQIKAALAEQPAPDREAHPIGSVARQQIRLQPLVAEREEKASHLQIADAGALIPNPAITSAIMHQQLAQVLDSATVDIVADPTLEPILPELTGSCANRGLHIVSGAAEPTIRIRLQLRTSATQVDGMERLDGTFQSLAETAKDGRKLGGMKIEVRSSSLTDAVARDRLLRKIAASWSSYLESDFIDCLTHL